MLAKLQQGISVWFYSVVGFVLISCGGGGGSGSAILPPVTQEPVDDRLLLTFSSDQEVLQFVRDGFAGAGSSRVAEVALAADASAPSVPTYSTSYRLEAEVAESDLVQYNGELLLIAPSRSGGCCFVAVDAALDVAADALLIPEPPGVEGVRVLVADAAQMRVEEEAEIPLSEGLMVEGLYLDQAQVQMVSSSSWWGAYGWNSESVGAWEGQILEIANWSLTDPAAPILDGRLRIEGGYVQSRKVGSTIAVISRFTPELPDYIYYPSTQEHLDSNLAVLEQLDLDAILPKLQWNEAPVEMLSASECLRVNPNHEWASTNTAYPVVTLVTQVDAATAEPLHIQCYLGDSSGVYLTANHLYLLESDRSSDPGTFLHQFDLRGGTEYQGSGRVDGQLFLGDQRDFRLSESAGFLRMFTTRLTENPEDRFDHQLWILDATVKDGELKTVAQLPNSVRTEAIGKPNEDLYGVRFLGDRAYAVTFERRDPLYVFDLRDPSDPEIAGSLEIPGFSNFLHPVSEHVLLGIGRNALNIPKVELFDVTNLTQPLSLGTADLGAELLWSYTPAEYDRRAFTVLEGDTYRFTVPLSGTAQRDGLYTQERRLYGFSIDSPTVSSQARLLSEGYMSAATDDVNAADEPMRSVIDGDSVLFVTGTSVYFAPWGDLASSMGPN